MPAGYVCSGSLKGFPKEGRCAGHPATSRCASSSRRSSSSFFAEHAPDGVSLDDLSLLGPLFVLKLKNTPEGLDRKLVTELWLYPDGSRILELSTKCEPSEAFQVAAEARAYLSSRGIDLGGEQQTKTRSALEFFASQLGDEGQNS